MISWTSIDMIVVYVPTSTVNPFFYLVFFYSYANGVTHLFGQQTQIGRCPVGNRALLWYACLSVRSNGQGGLQKASEALGWPRTVSVGSYCCLIVFDNQQISYVKKSSFLPRFTLHIQGTLPTSLSTFLWLHSAQSTNCPW